MDRQFGLPFGGGFGFGHQPFFNPFFFPRRRFVPFFFFSPFFFPFFRAEEDRDGTYFMQHAYCDGDTMESLAQAYNVPVPVLEAVNPQLQQPNALPPGSIVHIPRMDKMHCQKMFMEQEVPESAGAYPQFPQQPFPAYSQQPSAAYPGYAYPGLPNQHM